MIQNIHEVNCNAVHVNSSRQKTCYRIPVRFTHPYKHLAPFIIF